MSEANASSVAISSVEQSTPGSNDSTPRKAQRRKGFQAKSRDAEKFRVRKNETFDKKRQNDLDRKFGKSTAVETLFGMPRLMTTRPPIKISVSTKYILELSRSLVEMYRSACKVNIVPSDIVAVALTTVMQVEAKVWFSQQSTPFASVNDDVERRARRVKAVLPNALYPISFYVDQIGLVDHEHQKFVPDLIDLTYGNLLDYIDQIGVTPLPSGTIPLLEGNALTGARQWVRLINQDALIANGVIQIIDGRTMFTEGFLERPNEFNWIGHLMLEPWRDVLPAFDEIVNNYNNLIGRISRRVTEPISSVDFSQARGTAAQLVTSGSINDLTSVEVWSNRYIDDESLTVGALLRFGYELADHDDSHARDFRCVEAVVETAGSIERFTRNVVTKLR